MANEIWLRPSTDHSILSPSGRVSKRARDAALTREVARLFPPGYWDEPEPTADEARKARIITLRRSASGLRALAAHGMSRRKFSLAADALEAEAIACAIERKGTE